MSKHRIKSFEVDDDYYDNYDDAYDDSYENPSDNLSTEDNALTAEDIEKLRIGTAQVRSVLRQGFSSTTDKEIQDTLWHYYYDVSKSVGYLKSTETHLHFPKSSLILLVTR
jgi:elongation factor 1 alpha-like protein